MAASFYFYDLETSGFDPRTQRIMQFAGQRTDMDLKPIGEPHNILIKLTPEIVPDPDAILVTGITPQTTIADGVTEAEFLKIFCDEIVQPNTTFLGYNTIRFDDEFMRFLLYRNFYDAYEWQWTDDCSRWDLLDVVRMTRALRPEGVKWPFASDGRPTNRLELLTSLNGLDHENAHDALNDVYATIAVAKLIRDKQPDLFQYLFKMRSKKAIEELVQKGQPFVYSSGKYPSEFEKTTVVWPVADNPNRKGATLVYDLRHDPDEFTKLSVGELAERWKWMKEPDSPRLPVKTIQFNRCPAIAPLGVLQQGGTIERLAVNLDEIKKNLAKLKAAQDFPAKLLQALELLDKKRQTAWISDEQNVDGQLYDSFIGDEDKKIERAIRAAEPDSLGEWADKLHDDRLKKLLPLYKARNYPSKMSDDERKNWEAFCKQRLTTGGQSSRLAKYFERLQTLANDTTLTGEKRYLLEELQLYGQSVMPVTEEA
jgi:exodeoxyribonuclease I